MWYEPPWERVESWAPMSTMALTWWPFSLTWMMGKFPNLNHCPSGLREPPSLSPDGGARVPTTPTHFPLWGYCVVPGPFVAGPKGEGDGNEGNHWAPLVMLMRTVSGIVSWLMTLKTMPGIVHPGGNLMFTQAGSHYSWRALADPCWWKGVDHWSLVECC